MGAYLSSVRDIIIIINQRIWEKYMLARSRSNSRRITSYSKLLSDLLENIKGFLNDSNRLWNINEIENRLIAKCFAESTQVGNYQDKFLKTYIVSLNSIVEAIQSFPLAEYPELATLHVRYQQLIKNLEAEQSARDIASQTNLSILLDSPALSTSRSLSPKEKDRYYKEDKFHDYTDAEKESLKAAVIFDIEGTLYCDDGRDGQFYYSDLVRKIVSYAREKKCAVHVLTKRDRLQSDDPERFKELLTANEILHWIGITVDSVHYTSYLSKLPILENLRQRYNLPENKILMVDDDESFINVCKELGFSGVVANSSTTHYLNTVTEFITKQGDSAKYSAHETSYLTLNGYPFFSRSPSFSHRTVQPLLSNERGLVGGR